MSQYRRWFVPGGTFFFTVVSYGRRRILTTDEGRRILRGAIEAVRKKHPFEILATVLLPDHWHLIMRLPRADKDYSTRMKRVKEEFTVRWLEEGLAEAVVTPAQRRDGERGIWQPRFWEHTIEDEADLERCFDYVHWNPRKHGIVSRVQDWPYSSFHRHVLAGQYELEWGGAEPKFTVGRSDWGEPR